MSERITERALPRLAVAVLVVLACTTSGAEQLLVDPTRPAGWNPGQAVEEPGMEGDSATMVLQAIFSSGGGRSAVINGTRVRVGDHLAGGEVIEIGHNHVSVRNDAAVVELRVGIAPVKTPTGPDAAVASSLVERAGGPMR